MGKTYDITRVPRVMSFMRKNRDIIYTAGVVANILDITRKEAHGVLQSIYHNYKQSISMYRVGSGEYSLHKPEREYTSRADQIECFVRKHGMASTDELVKLTGLPPNVVQTVVQRMKTTGQLNVKPKYYYVLQEGVAEE